MLAFLEDPAGNGPRWMQFGGLEAMASYGVDVPTVSPDIDWSEVRNALIEVLPACHLHFLQGLDLGFAWQGYLFIHAGLHPDHPIEAQDAHDLMWIREPFLNSLRDWGAIVVHGHVIVDEPEFGRTVLALTPVPTSPVVSRAS
jgi:serine/threonine protein phosphatase 1